MRRIKHSFAAVAGAVLIALIAAACGTSSSVSGPTVKGPATGPGYTQPTKPSGAKVSGGTVYWTEAPDTPPNYIFPMTAIVVCGTNNISEFNAMMYRPLYWYGNNYSPTIDYNLSIGQPPTFSDGDKTVTVKLNPGWKWSDGEPVTSRDVLFWMNLYKASPSTNYCGYVPGYFPDNVVSYSAPNASTVVFHLNKSYNPTWFTYNELSQIYPMPLAWDRTSLSQPAPTSDNGHLPDAAGTASAQSVYKFLDTQSKSLGTWATSPLWSVVDGPFKLQSFTSSGEATLVPNPDYTGSPKPTISKFVEIPFTSEAALYNEIRSGGPSALTIADIPSQYAPQVSALAGEGYFYSKAGNSSFNFFPLNTNNPTVGPIFRQLYFRQAFQHLIDQQGWINAFLFHTANVTYNPVPVAPPNPFVSTSSISNPYPFSPSAAAALLKAHGWSVVPGGATTCQNPSLCGPGIKKGEGISFTLDYESGVVAVKDEMDDLAAQAKKLGINITLTTHPFNTVISEALGCTPNQPVCKWQAVNWGAGWIYAPDFLPTGESLFNPGAVANYSSVTDPTTTKLIDETIFGPAGHESAALTAYAKQIADTLPVVFGPTSYGSYIGDAGTLVAKNLAGYTSPAFGYLTPEFWHFTK